MIYSARVHVGETDPELARDKAERIYAMLGPEFFSGPCCRTPEKTVDWIERTLLNNDLLVEFESKDDAMLFKLAFA